MELKIKHCPEEVYTGSWNKYHIFVLSHPQWHDGKTKRNRMKLSQANRLAHMGYDVSYAINQSPDKPEGIAAEQLQLL